MKALISQRVGEGLILALLLGIFNLAGPARAEGNDCAISVPIADLVGADRSYAEDALQTALPNLDHHCLGRCEYRYAQCRRSCRPHFHHCYERCRRAYQVCRRHCHIHPHP